MGFLKSDNTQQKANNLADEQIQQNAAELEQKKNNLFQTRLDIIKGQGSEVWTPRSPNAPTTAPVGKR